MRVELLLMGWIVTIAAICSTVGNVVALNRVSRPPTVPTAAPRFFPPGARLSGVSGVTALIVWTTVPTGIPCAPFSPSVGTSSEPDSNNVDDNSGAAVAVASTDMAADAFV
jgi:hypothetical protein